jgi:2-C-methyl-D-erythritol 4-phosphate cytidylyltransferase
MNYICILSAGKGTRLGLNKNKGLLKITTETLLEMNITNFINNDLIDKILVVSDEESKDEIDYILNIMAHEKLITQSVLGGLQRQDSAFNGIKYLSNRIKEDDIIMIHNVANPFVSDEDISNLISKAKLDNASVLARKVSNTIRKVDNDLYAIKLIDREDLYEMETPQAIKGTLALEAFEKAYQDGYYGTDDVALVERIGHKVSIVKTSEYNFKITTKKDLYLAKYLLENNLI